MVDERVGGSKQFSAYTVQAGNPVSRDQMFRMTSENMLANVIAFEEAGGPLKELKQAVGGDGGTLVGRAWFSGFPSNNDSPRKRFIAHSSMLDRHTLWSS